MNARCLSDELHKPLMYSLENKLPASLLVYSVIRWIAYGPLEGFRVWTDNWPDYSAVVISADKTKVKNPYLQDQVYVYCENESGLRKIVMHKGTFDITRTRMNGLSKESMDFLDKEFHNVTGSWPDSGWTLILFELPAHLVVSPPPLPDDIREGVVNDDTAHTVIDNWITTEPGCLEFFKSKLSTGKLLSVCLYNEENTPIAWSVEQIYGSIGMTFVLSKYRRSGFGKYVTMRLAEKLKGRGESVYSCIEESNIASIKMHEDTGFSRVKPPCSELIWKKYCYKKVC